MNYIAYLIARRVLRANMIYMPRPLHHYWLAIFPTYASALIQGAFLLSYVTGAIRYLIVSLIC